MAQFTFGPFTFDGMTARLSRDNADVRLRPQALQVLRVLLQHGGRPLGYDQMIAEAWQGTFVSRHTVDVTVGEVKKVLGEYGRWIVHRPKVGYSLVVPTSDELVRKGWHFASRRTKEGAERAIDCFHQAASQCPGDFRAFEGLSTCYLMQATFGICAPVEVYPRFIDAHNRAVEQGTLGLDDPVAAHIAEWRGDDRAHVTIRDLLSHSSGLPAHRHYYSTIAGSTAFRAAICAEPLDYEPRASSVYSDLGFMLLGFMLEARQPLVGADRPHLVRCEADVVGDPADEAVDREGEQPRPPAPRTVRRRITARSSSSSTMPTAASATRSTTARSRSPAGSSVAARASTSSTKRRFGAPISSSCSPMSASAAPCTRSSPRARSTRSSRRSRRTGATW